ncbi:MAG: DNA/RNA non-specific endonuclease [Muribaculaceae bacterium]|nr:DNA/RNA non-specific endonuclease [Muribaculaceae bacterium]
MKRFKHPLMIAMWLVVIALFAWFKFTGNDADAPDAPVAAEASTGTAPTGFATPADYNSPGATTVAGSIEEVGIPGGTPNQTVSYPGFTVHYNSNLHLPNCVVYTLTANETRGRAERQEQFEVDENVWGCAEPYEYSGSGYDRGHMAPAGDFKWSDDAMASTFKMSNVCPQNHELNKGAWNDLEIKVREWARRDRKLVVYTGPVFNDKKNAERIGKKSKKKKPRVAVPTAFYKVIYAPDARPSRAIAFVMPNKPCGGNLKDYVTSVDEVERLTGIDFLSSLPSDKQQRLQADSNTAIWFHSR